jgi:hypothetical protein
MISSSMLAVDPCAIGIGWLTGLPEQFVGQHVSCRIAEEHWAVLYCLAAVVPNVLWKMGQTSYVCASTGADVTLEPTSECDGSSSELHSITPVAVSTIHTPNTPYTHFRTL